MVACAARRLREQDFNCVPDAIGVDLITTIIACTGTRGAAAEGVEAWESSDRFAGAAFDRKNTVLFKLYSAIGSLSSLSPLSIDKRFHPRHRAIGRLDEHFIAMVAKTTATVDR